MPTRPTTCCGIKEEGYHGNGKTISSHENVVHSVSDEVCRCVRIDFILSHQSSGLKISDINFEQIKMDGWMDGNNVKVR